MMRNELVLYSVRDYNSGLLYPNETLPAFAIYKMA